MGWCRCTVFMGTRDAMNICDTKITATLTVRSTLFSKHSDGSVGKKYFVSMMIVVPILRTNMMERDVVVMRSDDDTLDDGVGH